jgi:hypothetical protein
MAMDDLPAGIQVEQFFGNFLNGLGARDIEHPAALVFHRQKLALVTFQLPLHQPLEGADPVIDMDDVITLQQVCIQ